MRTSLLLIAAVALTGCRSNKPAWFVATSTPETLRHTTGGDVVGGAGRFGSNAWLGIPFAAPPIGPLRWRAPQPAAAWKEPLVATHFKHVCMQPATPLVVGEEDHDGIVGSEDCLYLNIWAPQHVEGDQRLPVMVWIHGGGNSIGGANSYDLGHLASGQKVIGVSVQYRLGPLGWLRHAALREGADPLDASGNFGTLDLIAALQWVHDNAAAFGGNPDKVTVFGESAGAQNTYSLLLSPKAKGLFHRAIAQSPVISRATLAGAEGFADDPEPGHKTNSSNEALLRLLVSDGAADRAAARQKVATMTRAKIAEYLRSKTGAAVVQTYVDGTVGRALKMLDMPLVFPDGAVLPAEAWPDAFARADGWNQMPVMIGTNHDEAKLFLFLDPRFTWKLFGVLPRVRDEPSYEASSETMSRLWRATAIDIPAAAMRASGASQVFSYRFDWAREPTKMGTDLSKLLGAAHGLEIPFVHGNFEGELGKLLGEEGSAERDTLSASMMAYWGEFARNGDPGKGGGTSLPQWTPYDTSAPEAAKFMTLDAAPPGLRMGNQVEQVDAIVADMIADRRIADMPSKCSGLAGLAKIGFLTQERYALIKECAASEP